MARVGEYLKDEPIAAIYSSPRKRALESAEILVAGNAVFGKGDAKGNAEALLEAARSASLQRV